MRNIIKIILACWLCVSVDAYAQELSFISPEVEKGVRQHLNINDGEAISFAQLDTITDLDLSRRGITDIHDIVLMPQLRTLDLSYNMLDDLQPLALLDSLEWLDLSYNSLKGINDLFYSTAKDLTVNVSFNHIRDFSLFGSMSPCHFTLEGTGLQMSENAPFFEVCHLFCDASANKAVVNGMVRTNMTEAAQLVCGEYRTEVSADGNFFKKTLDGNYTETVPVFLDNGIYGDSTYLVPSVTMEVNPEETVALPTGLPESYTIKLTKILHGSVDILGTELLYTAPDVVVKDTLSFCYYEYGVLKGFSEYYLGKSANILLGDANGDGSVSVADVLITVDYVLGNNPIGFVFANANVSGDNDVTLADITGIVDIVLNQTSASIPAKSRESVVDAMALTAKGSHCALHLDNREPCRGISFTVTLPEGGTMGNLKVPASRADGHFALANAVAPGRYNVVVYGNSGKPLRDDATAMLLFDISGCQASDITVGNIQMVNDRNETILLPATYGIATGIADVEGSDGNDSQPWYNTVGVGYDKPTHGVNIHNGKKTGVK